MTYNERTELQKEVDRLSVVLYTIMEKMDDSEYFELTSTETRLLEALNNYVNSCVLPADAATERDY